MPASVHLCDIGMWPPASRIGKQFLLTAIVSNSGLGLFHHHRRGSRIHLAQATMVFCEDYLLYNALRGLDIHGSSHRVWVSDTFIHRGEGDC